jgi:hypothetical protein
MSSESEPRPEHPTRHDGVSLGQHALYYSTERFTSEIDQPRLAIVTGFGESNRTPEGGMRERLHLTILPCPNRDVHHAMTPEVMTARSVGVYGPDEKKPIVGDWCVFI